MFSLSANLQSISYLIQSLMLQSYGSDQKFKIYRL